MAGPGTAAAGLLVSEYDTSELYGRNGNDTLIGGDGPDLLVGAAGNDTQNGRGGSDNYPANGSEARLDVFADSGGGGTDTLKNESSAGLELNGFSNLNGIDVVDAGGFSVRGNTGNNTLDFRAAALVNVSYVDGGSGADAIYASNVAVSNPSFEGYFGDAGNDSLYGGAADDKLFGEAGNDVLEGGAGKDTLVGGTGTDTLTGGAGNDTFYLGDLSGPVVNKDTNSNGIDDDEELFPSFIG